MIPKFRAWDKDSKVMRPWKNLILEKDDGDDFWLIGYEESKNIVSYDHDQILMQSTGLKDKNGVEIFEGDIVRWHDVVTWDYSVTFKYGVFCISDDPSSNFYHLKEDINGKFEVIGNIYENPELLEQANA